MRAFLYTIALLLFIISAYAQTSSADAAINKIQEIKDDTLRMDSLYHFANNNLDNDPKLSIRVGKILLQDAEVFNYPKGIANANMVIAYGYEYVSEYTQCLKYYLEALRLYKELKMFRPEINAALGVSGIYSITNDIDNERKYAEEAMTICEQNISNDRIRRMKPRILDYLATVYKKEASYDTSIKLYTEAIGLAKADGDTKEVVSSLCNLAIALKTMKNYNASLNAYNEAVSLIDTTKDAYYYSVIIDNMAVLFYQMGNLPKSEQYALNASAIMLKTNNVDGLRDCYETLKNVYEQEKKYPLALEYYTKWSATKDTILNREKSQQIAEWQTKFDTEAKDKEIADQKKKLEYNHKINLSLGLSSVLLLSMGLIVYRNYKSQKRSNILISKEKQRSEDLLLNILPSEVADELKNKGNAEARHFENVTVMFTDFVNFTKASERMTPQQLIDELHFCFKAFDDIIDRYKIEKIKTIGDSYLAVSGLPMAIPNHAVQTARAATEINAFVAARKIHMGDAAFEVRIGIHSGSVVAGIVGVKKFSYDIWGDTVNTAARMEQNSEPGKINISQTTFDLIKDKFNCTYRGEIEAKNKGKLGMYFVDRPTQP